MSSQAPLFAADLVSAAAANARYTRPGLSSHNLRTKPFSRAKVISLRSPNTFSAIANSSSQFAAELAAQESSALLVLPTPLSGKRLDAGKLGVEFLELDAGSGVRELSTVESSASSSRATSRSASGKPASSANNSG
jgi:hypothetical protein